MIRAIKFWCEGSFQVLIEENDTTWSWSVKSLSLERLTSPAYFKKTQASKLGDAQHPLLYLQIIRSSLIVLYFYCFIPVYFSLERQFVLFSFVCCYTCWILAFLCGRETRSTHFHFEYSCASLIPVEYSCLAAVFAHSSKFLYVSWVEFSVFFWRKYSLASLIFVWRVFK